MNAARLQRLLHHATNQYGPTALVRGVRTSGDTLLTDVAEDYDTAWLRDALARARACSPCWAVQMAEAVLTTLETPEAEDLAQAFLAFHVLEQRFGGRHRSLYLRHAVSQLTHDTLAMAETCLTDDEFRLFGQFVRDLSRTGGAP